MLESLEKRFSHVQETKEVVLACLLYPRYKERPFSPETLAKAKAWLSEEVETTPQQCKQTQCQQKLLVMIMARETPKKQGWRRARTQRTGQSL